MFHLTIIQFWLLVSLAIFGGFSVLSVAAVMLWFLLVVRRFKRSANQRIDEVFREYQFEGE